MLRRYKKVRNILLLDYELNQGYQLEALVQDGENSICLTACTGVAQAKYIVEKSGICFDLFVLETELPDGSGVEFALWLRSIQKYAFAWIVFVTGCDRRILEAVNAVHCYSYIMKPCAVGDIASVVQHLAHIHIDEIKTANTLSLAKKGLNYKLDVDDILYIETTQKDIDIHITAKTIHLSRISLKKILGLLPREAFIQCHRSYILNRALLQSYESKNRNAFVTLTNGEKIPVGSKFRDDIFTFINSLGYCQ
jgi:DNA-binding LytR/AlgR family response regulator